LNKLIVQGNGVIVVDSARGFKAEDVVEVDSIGRAVNVSQAVRTSKADVVLGSVGLFKETIGSLNSADALATESFDETVLMGAVTSFDTTFGLRGMGQDHGNTEATESAANLSKPFVFALGVIDSGFIGVDLTRNAIALNVKLKSEKDVTSVLGPGQSA